MAYSKHVELLEPVDMAELFIIPNVIYDTTDDQDRRVFIDKAGKPVKQPMQTIGGVTKVKLPKGTPAVYLHGSQRWIRGQNIGTAHDFKPIGTIRKYTPDPSLHGPQGQAGTADPVKS